MREVTWLSCGGSDYWRRFFILIDLVFIKEYIWGLSSGMCPYYLSACFEASWIQTFRNISEYRYLSQLFDVNISAVPLS